MEKFLVFLMAFAISCFAVSKPMESVENYNVLMVHGAYGWNEGFIWPHMPKSYWEKDYGYEDFPFQSGIRTRLNDVIETLNVELPSAYEDTLFLGKANIGYYGSESRLTYWLNKKIFEDDSSRKPQDSYIYHWRSFSNPANSSVNNARELGFRKWNSDGTYGKRRALVEEAQEVKAIITQEVATDSGIRIDTTEKGQVALEIIRKNPDLYRQLASRYILIGHSMGGVVL